MQLWTLDHADSVCAGFLNHVASVRLPQSKFTNNMTTTDDRNEPKLASANGRHIHIKDEDIFIVNPFFRLRNSNGRVIIYGAEGIGTYAAHKAHAIVVALCNGKRTVSDIVRLTRPFVTAANEEDALKTGTAIVKAVMSHYIKTKEEQQQQETRPSDFPATSVLISKSDYDAKVRRLGVSEVQYDPEKFLPKDATDIADLNATVLHEQAPISINWHFTSECSTDCKYCYLRRRDVKPLPKERTLSLIEEAAQIGVLNISPNGGDILLYKHLKEVMKLTTGSIVELNRTMSEPVDIIVNNCVIARGEVVVVEGNFGVRIHEVVSRQERLRTLY